MSDNHFEIEVGSTVIPRTSLTTVHDATDVRMEFSPRRLVLHHQVWVSDTVNYSTVIEWEQLPPCQRTLTQHQLNSTTSRYSEDRFAAVPRLIQ